MKIAKMVKLNVCLAIFAIIAFRSSFGCPKGCQCNNKSYKCIDNRLTEIPKDIPVTVVYIDLSHNKLRPIDENFFLRFYQLQTLLLDNCGQKGPIYLPSSLRVLEFSANQITENDMKKMLSKQFHSLESIKMRDNRMNVTGLFPLLPKGVVTLDIGGNVLTHLRKGDLACCVKLKSFACDHCGLTQIESRAFDMVQDLFIVTLNSNELTALPDGIFKRNTKLNEVNLRGNHLEDFNATTVGIRTLKSLDVGYNRIKSFDLKSLGMLSIDLSNNRLTELNHCCLCFKTVTYYIYLQNNQISYVSPSAFSTLKFISELVMHNNSLEMLPQYLFKGKYIGKIFLHQNNLANFSGVLLGIKKAPFLLTLSGNKELVFLNDVDFESMANHSDIFVTCKYLKGMKISSKLRASVKCSPSADLVFKSPSRFFAYSGYICTWDTPGMEFTCHACPVGYFSTGDGLEKTMGQCAKCPPGSFYQDEVAMTSCKSCPIGQYVPPDLSPGKDASYCKTCPEGTNTNSSSGTRACRCLNGFYRLYRFGACEKCPRVGFECTRDYPQLSRGYWSTWNGTKSGNRTCRDEFKAFMSNLETYDNTYDRKTVRFNCQLPIPTKCPIPGSCEGGMDASCSPGYTGVLCAVCKKGYSKQFNRCVKCPHAIIVILEFIGYAVLFILLCLVILWTGKVTDASGQPERQQGNPADDRTLADIVMSGLKILIGFYQVLISILRAFGYVNWPKAMLKAVSIMEYIQFEVIRIPSLRCIKPEWDIDSVKEFWFALLVSLTVLVMSLLFFLMKVGYLHCSEASILDFRKKRKACGKQCIKVVALFTFVTYPLTSSRIFQILPISCHTFCTAMQNGTCAQELSYLHSDYSIACPTLAQYKYTLIAAYCSLAIPFCLPLLLWALLRRYAPRKPSQDIPSRMSCPPFGCSVQEVMEDDGYNDECCPLMGRSMDRTPVFTYALRFTYENYEPECWYWEVIEMVRKLTMTVGVSLFLDHTKIGLSTIIILAMAFVLLHGMKKPIRDRFENLLQLLSLLIIPINLSIGVILRGSVADSLGRIEKELDSRITGVILVCLNSLLIILFVGRLLNAVYSRLKKRYNASPRGD